MTLNKPIPTLLFILILAVLAAGCGNAAQSTPTPPPTLVPPTATPLPPPTPTPEPAAVIVNGEGIPMADYQAELERLKKAEAELGLNSSPEDQKRQVLDLLVGQTLLAQEAQRSGDKVEDAALDTQLQKMSQEIKERTLADWMAKNGYTEESLKRSMRRSMLAAYQRDQIAAGVADSAEQVNVRQILVLDSVLADTIYKQLKSGADFTLVAYQYDTQTGGALGWFPRGYLTLPEVEEAAFTLQPGEYSAVLETRFGYQIIQVIEKDSKRKLTADARKVLQHKAIEAWMEKRLTESKVEILVK